MLDYKLKIALVPERRYLPGPKRTGIFNPDYAVKNKERIVSYIKSRFADEITEFTDLEWLNEEGLLYLESDCEKVAERLKAEKVDAIFLINCNFGNEEAAGENRTSYESARFAVCSARRQVRRGRNALHGFAVRSFCHIQAAQAQERTVYLHRKLLRNRFRFYEGITAVSFGCVHGKELP